LKRHFILAFALISCSLLSYGQASGPRAWTRITAPKDSNSNEVALLRGRDGVLHVAWKRQTTPQKMDLLHTAVDPQGNASPMPSIIVEGWGTLTIPALVLEKNGTLRAVFAGLLGTTGSPYNAGSVYSATSTDGKSWKLQPGQLSASGYAYQGPITAAIDGQGNVVVGWAGSVQKGLGPKVQPHQLQQGCCSYNPGLATDSVSGETFIGWYSNENKNPGTFVQKVSPQIEQKILAPGSVVMENGAPQTVSLDEQAPLSGRIGAPGVFIAYCTGVHLDKTVNLWQIGHGQPFALGKVNGNCRTHVSPGPEGRLWVVWSDRNMFYATRSNKAVTRFGNIISIVPPPKWDSTFNVKGEGSAGPLDVFAQVDLSGDVSNWQTHVLPSFNVSTTPKAVPAAGGNVTFSVTDVGDPVSGATIQIAGQTLTTDASGQASVKLAKGGAVPFTVTAPGYTQAKLTLGGGGNPQKK
jgi:hypothetical protein